MNKLRKWNSFLFESKGEKFEISKGDITDSKYDQKWTKDGLEWEVTKSKSGEVIFKFSSSEDFEKAKVVIGKKSKGKEDAKEF